MDMDVDGEADDTQGPKGDSRPVPERHDAPKVTKERTSQTKTILVRLYEAPKSLNHKSQVQYIMDDSGIDLSILQGLFECGDRKLEVFRRAIPLAKPIAHSIPQAIHPRRRTCVYQYREGQLDASDAESLLEHGILQVSYATASNKRCTKLSRPIEQY